MNRKELVARIALNMGKTKKETDEFVDMFTKTITEVLKEGDRVCISGFGYFETRDRTEHTRINPRTGKEVLCKAKKVPVFKAGTVFKAAVN